MLPSLSSDGRLLAFSSNRLGEADLWLQRVDDSGPAGPPRRLTDLPGTVAASDFSPDGHWLAFTRVLDGNRDVWMMPIAGGMPHNLTDRPGVDMHPAFSPDSRSVAFISDRLGGQHVWVARVWEGRLAGEPRQVTFGDTLEIFPAFSPDGGHIAFVRDRGAEADVWIAPVDAGHQPRRVSHDVVAHCVRWHPNGRGLLVSGIWADGRADVRWVPEDGGAGVALEPPVDFGAGINRFFDVSGDGHRIAFSAIDRRGDIWLLETGTVGFR